MDTVSLRDQNAVSESAKTDRHETVAELLSRLDPQPGDMLLFHHPERLRSLLICLFTQSRFYHVAIYAGNGEVIEARLPNVVRRNLYWQRDGFRFVVVRAPSREAGLKALTWAEKKVGAPYDLKNLLKWIAGRLLHIPSLCRCSAEDRYICGNFVVRAFLAAGVDLFPGRSPAEICPADFAGMVEDRESATEAGAFHRSRIACDTGQGHSENPTPVAAASASVPRHCPPRAGRLPR